MSAAVDERVNPRELTIAGRQALQAGRVDNAIALLGAAVKANSNLGPAWLALGHAYVKKMGGIPSDTAAMCYMKSWLSAKAQEGQSPAHAQLAMVSAENMRLMASQLVPRDWFSLLGDEARARAFARAVRLALRNLCGAEPTLDACLSTSSVHSLHSESSRPFVWPEDNPQSRDPAHMFREENVYRAGLEDGGHGFESLHVLQAGAPGVFATAVARMGVGRVTSVQPNRLLQMLEASVAGANGLADRVSAVAGPLRSIQVGASGGMPRKADLLIVGAALTANKVTAEMMWEVESARPLLLPGAAVLPAAVRVRAVLIQSERLRHLNQVGLAEVKAECGVDLRAFNKRLRCGRRAIALHKYEHRALSAPWTALTLDLKAALGAEPGKEDTFREAACEVEVAAGGRADCVVWWTECDMGVRNSWSSAPEGLWSGPQEALPYDAASSTAHVWQQASFVRGREGTGGVTKGDRISITARLSADGVHFDLSALEKEEAGGEDPLSPDLDGGEVWDDVDQAESVLPYHASMLNDHYRTRAFRLGIEGAAKEAEKRWGKPVVLDIGAGTGLLSIFASRASPTAKVFAVEKTPAMAAVCAETLEQNAARGVKLVKKLSTEMETGEGKDMPEKAHLLVTEIFGTDPLSEGVLGTLHHARGSLLRKDAIVFPARVRVVAALASSESVMLRRGGALLTARGGGAAAAAAEEAAAGGAEAGGAAVGGPVGRGPVDGSPLGVLQPNRFEEHLDFIDDLRVLTEPTVVGEIDLSGPEVEMSGRSICRVIGTLPARLPRRPAPEGGRPQPPAGPERGHRRPGGDGDADMASPGGSTPGGERALGRTVSTPHAATPQSVPTPRAGFGRQSGGGRRLLDQLREEEGGSLVQATTKATCVVHWYELDCGAGGWMSTSPADMQYGEHWVQSIELLPAEQDLQVARGAEVDLHMHYSVDRVWFTAEAVQAAGP